MTAPVPIPALASFEIPEWEGSSDDFAGGGAFVGEDEFITEPAVVADIDALVLEVRLWEVEVIVDILEGTDVSARDVGP